MSIRVRSTVPVICDPREQKLEKVIIEITNWTYNINSGYSATILDYYDSTTENIETPAPLGAFKNILKSKQNNYSFDQVNYIFSQVDIPNEVVELYSDHLDGLLAKSLLFLTQNELNEAGKTVYGLLPEEWEIIV